MVKLAANLTMLFTEFEFPDRMARAAEAGFTAVEYLFPYDYPADDLRDWNDAAGVRQVLINCPAGDWAAGERGIACLPDRKNEFRDGIGIAIDYANKLDCPSIHLVAGLAPDGGILARTAHENTYRENIAFAADELAQHGMTGMLETLNDRDVPGFLLNRTDQVLEILGELQRPNLKMQFDAYHVQIMEGDLCQRFGACVDHIGHVQIANPPHRHEPDRGEINYGYFLSFIDETGYDDWVACEYIPASDTIGGLGWGRAFGLLPDS